MTANATETAQADPGKEHTVPPLKQRILGVLLDPVATFRELEPSWGLMGPWLAVMGAGLLYAVVAIAQVDHAALTEQRTAYEQSFFSDQQRRAVAQMEQSVNLGKWGSFVGRLVLIGGPSVGAILGIVVMGLILFGASWLLGGKRDLLRAIVVAAHAKLVTIVLYALLFVGTVMKNPIPTTSLRNVADEVAQPVLSAALSIVDPIAIWHTVLLGIGLAVSLGVKQRRAVLVVGALHVVPWLLGLAMAGLTVAQRK